MTIETTTDLSPEHVLEEAKRFFTAPDAVAPAALLDESDSHVTLGMFRSRLAIHVSFDPDTSRTRVRLSTLRGHEAVGKFLTRIGAEPRALEDGGR